MVELRSLPGGADDDRLDGDHLADHILTELAPFTIGPPRWLRATLVAVAGLQLLVSLPWLVGTDPLGLLGNASVSHLTRDGALGLAIATAGLITAWRPRYAIAAALVSLAAVTAQVATAVIDDHYRRVSLLVEAAHLITLVVTVLVAAATRTAPVIRRERPPGLRSAPDRAGDPTRSS